MTGKKCFFPLIAYCIRASCIFYFYRIAVNKNNIVALEFIELLVPFSVELSSR